MDQSMFTPMVENTAGEQRSPRIYLPELKNYAEDEATLQQIKNLVVNVIDRVRIDRVPLEEEWRAIMRMEALRHDKGRRYYGRSDAYVPIYANTVRTLVSMLTRGVFPSDDYFDVGDAGTGDPEKSKPVKAYLRWELERVANIRGKFKQFIRSLVHFGNSPMKVWYRQDIKKRIQKRKLATILGDESQEGFAPELKNVYAYDGLAVSARNLLHWYMWPTTAENIDEATMIFEDIPVPRGYIEDMLRKHVWKNADAALNSPVPSNYQVTEADQLTTNQGLTPPTNNVIGQNSLGEVRVLTEVWTYLVLPASAYLDYEDKDEAIPVRLVMAGNVCLECTRNPYWHQRPPYLVARTNVLPGLFYGYGHGKLARSLQYLANDFMNQTNDCGNYVLNPVTKVNIGGLAGPLRPISPGVVWNTTDTSAIEFDRPPIELIQAGLSMFGAISSLEQDQSGAPSAVQGIGAKGAAKTATGAQILQRNATMPLQDVVEDIETDVMQPLLWFTWMNAQQFRTKEVMAIVGETNLKVSPEMLIIDPVFRWLASSQATNQAQRAQQLISLFQVAMPAAPMMMQQGYEVDPAALLSRIASDGFGYRDFNRFVRKLTPEEMLQRQQAMMMAQAQQGGGEGGQSGQQGKPGDRVRSTAEQAGDGSGGGEMAPGEGEDFMQVRQDADQMSAQAGALSGLIGQ